MKKSLPARLLAILLVATMLSLGLGSALPSPASATTPGTPGVPQAGTPVYTEDFSNQNASSAAISILNYTGGPAAANMTYTADPQYTPAGGQCNGWILNSFSPQPSSSADAGCSNNAPGAWQDLKEMAVQLGLAQGQTAAQAADNQALSAYTNAESAQIAAGTEFRTASSSGVPAIPGHYYAVSAYFAEINCFSNHAQETFSLIINGIPTVLSTGLDPCGSDTTSSAAKVTKLQSAAYMVPLGTTANLGLSLYNAQTSGQGNDVAFDLPQIVDVTPQLDKTFSPTLIAPGQTSTVTLTVTNTSDLMAKTDWSITDTLPAGVVIAPTPAIGGTCVQLAGAAFVRTAAEGSNTFTATGGDLAVGQSSCTITFNVTAAAEGTYVNGPGNIVTNLNPPANAALTVRAPRITLAKALGAPREAATDQFTVQIRTGGAAGTVVNSTANSTTTGTGSTVTAGTGTTGAYVAAAGTTYTLTEAGAGTAKLANYASTVACTDSYGLQPGLPNGAAFIGSLGITPVAGANITCTLSNNALPIINVAKQAGTVTGPDTNGNFVANYTITVANTGSVPGSYGPLTDTPAFASNLAITGAAWTTSGSGAPAGGSSSTAGPYTLAPAGSGIGPGVTQTFGLAVTFRYTDASSPSACAGPGTGLYNSVAVPAGQEQGPTTDNSACVTPLPNLSVSKTVDPPAGTMVQSGQVLTYSLRFYNTSGTAPATVSYNDWLGDILDDSSLLAGSITTTSTGATPLAVVNNAGGSPKTLSINGTVGAGAYSVVRYRVEVNGAGTLGNASLKNYLAPSNVTVPPTSCPDSDLSCRVNPVGSWTLGKAASPASGTSINPGDPSANRVITYSVTATNATVNPITGVILSDDLSQVVNNAAFSVGSAKLSINGGTPVSVPNPGAGSKLLTPSFTLPGNATAVLTYSVTVNSNAWLVTLRNGATGNGVIPPARCVTGSAAPLDSACFTTNSTTGHLFVQKAGSGATQGSTIPLTGSTFEIRNDAGGQMGPTVSGVSSAVSGSPGLVEVRNLTPGTYWLLETKAPNGFSLLATPVKFTVAGNGSIALDPATAGTAVTVSGLTITVLDIAAVKLPAAGGPGAEGLLGATLGGTLLLMTSFALLILRRRNNKTPENQTP
ncbi:DUF7927 domain-containing protein [Arthrobacter bambusae]|uniref:DUF7927 domain-containing protein n=1 Tax=Arthrobacter bambusae TaxID=1338426 RepID=UPI00277D65D1|nr:SpaA isopeptide-forming pilin-related protein [Arthrobacter bambusae]MDQ0030705.1 putative repeat protein (TIGR01451 family) [Arthrobacter bambusae]MDQ0099008.1 putative repeat protein (TIGR01451 family) [Arthrobacter bambusae]